MAKIVENLGSAIQGILSDYKIEVQLIIEQEVVKTTKQIIDWLRSNTPKSNLETNHLADSWKSILEKDEKEVQTIIFSDRKGYIAHFLEFGTVKTPPQPFLRKAFDLYVPLMINRIKERLGG